MMIPIVPTTKLATIASGAATSSTIELSSGEQFVSFTIPATFTGASVTFQVSMDGAATWLNLYNEATQYSISVGASRCIGVNVPLFCGVRYLRIVSASNEGGDRNIYYTTRPV